MKKDLQNLFDKKLSKDPILAKAIRGLEPLQLTASGNVYHELVKNISYQQISYKAADTIYGRFLNLFKTSLFSPEELLQHDIDRLRSVGLSRQKASYIRNISEYFLENGLYNYDWDQCSDDEIITMLCKIKGVGTWTVKMILIFELQRPDIFPYEDLAIQYVVKELYDLKEEKTKLIHQMKKIASQWQPFRSFASLYLWSYRRYLYEQRR